MRLFAKPARSLAWAAFLTLVPYPDGREALGRSDADEPPKPATTSRAAPERPPLDADGLERLRLDVLAQGLSEPPGQAPARPAARRAPVLDLLPGEYSDGGYVTSVALAEVEAQRREIQALKLRLQELERLVEDCTSRMRQGG